MGRFYSISLLFNIFFFLIFSFIVTIFPSSDLPINVSDFKNFKFLTLNFKLPYLLDKPLGEDAFYLIVAASNLSEGKGLTGNFGEQITGIQPLIVFIYAVLAKLINFFNFNEIIFLRSIIFFNSLLVILFSFILYKISNLFLKKEDQDTNFLLTFVVTLFSFHIYRTFCYGLETSLYLVLFSLFVYKFIKIKRSYYVSFYDALILGLIIGLTGLARIDFGVIYFSILILYFFKFNFDIFKKLIFSGFLGLLIVSIWIYHIYNISGSLIPSSGAPKHLLLILKIMIPESVKCCHQLVKT